MYVTPSNPFVSYPSESEKRNFINEEQVQEDDDDSILIEFCFLNEFNIDPLTFFLSIINKEEIFIPHSLWSVAMLLVFIQTWLVICTSVGWLNEYIKICKSFWCLQHIVTWQRQCVKQSLSKVAHTWLDEGQDAFAAARLLNLQTLQRKQRFWDDREISWHNIYSLVSNSSSFLKIERRKKSTVIEFVFYFSFSCP